MPKYLYAIQYDDDSYCAPYTKYIFLDKESAFKFAKQEAVVDSSFNCVAEFIKEGNKFIENESYYFIIKSQYGNKSLWDGIQDYTFIDSKEYNERIEQRVRFVYGNKIR